LPLVTARRTLLIYNVRPGQGKEKAPPGAELAGLGSRARVVDSKFLLSSALSAKNRLPDLLPDNFLGRIGRGIHPDAQRGATTLPAFQP
jgi:hypothetical protein